MRTIVVKRIAIWISNSGLNSFSQWYNSSTIPEKKETYVLVDKEAPFRAESRVHVRN